MSDSLLEIKNLHTYFHTHAGLAKAVDGVSIQVSNGEIVGIVGESGCGKSVMARSILRLIKNPPGKIVAGEILFNGTNLLALSEKEMQRVRGANISMIFQEPMTSLNPVFSVGDQLAEVFKFHVGLGKKDALERSIELLRMVGIPSPELRIKDYPFQMSGGMRQRVMIAMALACRPNLLLADEPTTALDVTIQAQILELIGQLQEEFKMSVLLITHDLGVIAETVGRIFVMYAGKIFEQAKVADLFNNPLNPYTKGLMESMPSLDSEQDRKTEKLKEIKGIVPDLCALPEGCAFFPRCSQMRPVCQYETPELVKTEDEHYVRCWLYN
ncbi:MAG TPA: ABC transporter ATP-binding protein [bacterium]|nr:ABC transporter ATP-binding protein [bacterium]